MGVAHEVGVDLAAMPTDRTYDGEPLVTAEVVREYVAAREVAQPVDVDRTEG